MRSVKDGMLLYAVTDSSWLNGKTLASQVEECLKGGATFVQLREKELDTPAFIELAKEIKKVCARYDVTFVIDDNVEVALAVDADGVHVGQQDMPCAEARRLLGPGKIIGVSARTPEQARKAQADGADYIGTGAAFMTTTKDVKSTMTVEQMRAVCDSVTIPVVAIGGIKPSNVLELKGSGVDGIAVVSAIFAQPDVRKAAETLLPLAKELVASK